LYINKINKTIQYMMTKVNHQNENVHQKVNHY